ncbi:MAG: Fe-S cluster assembly ATPase SufC [Alphaproteobacteria bacterium]|nr:Fe-S cluster assembly ATPase SufC [Alphaproteobacteria bacterium]
MSALLDINNLHVNVDDKTVIKGLDLHIKQGEVHAIMGPNGSGKSTLAFMLAGRENYEITKGEVLFDGTDLSTLTPEARAAKGLFLAFQYPVEIPGVNNMNFLRASLNALRRARGEAEMDTAHFLRFVREKAASLGMQDDMLKRPVNAGFSGGEKKRNEMLQLAVLEPRLIVLDEIDSGLDIDALKLVADGVNALRSPERAMLIITHYQRLLDHIKPDRVHVLADGRIARSGDAQLAQTLEQSGYADYGGEPKQIKADKASATDAGMVANG